MKEFFRVFINIAVLAFLISLNSNLYSQNNFDKWFSEGTLRIDYYHTGTDKTEQILFKELRYEKYWGGSKTNVTDKFGYGNYLVKLTDIASGNLIFSYAFCSLFEEWQFTDEAKLMNRGFPESLIVPFPKAKVKVELFGRQFADNTFKLLYEMEVDPADVTINREQKVNAEVKKIHYSAEPDKALDMVFIGDGYTSSEINEFYDDVTATMNYLFGIAPFNKMKDKINVWAVAAISNESGTDVPQDGIWKSTALNTNFFTFRSDRYLTTSDFHSVRDYAALAPCDQVCILVNTDIYGGGGIYNFWNITSAKNVYRNEVFAHELGHSLGALGDEYYTDEVAYDEIFNKKTEPYQANLTTLVNFSSKWKDMMKSDTPVPTPVTKENATVLGVYEGGGYQAKGIYRPYISCKMKELGANFCPVCQKTLSDVILYYSE
jgi:hypothetical protein